MNLDIGNIYSFKINSGEELVAKVVDITGNDIIVITSPVSVGPSPGGGLGLVPSMFTLQEHGNVRLNTKSIALVADTDETIKTKYIEATTGLRVPDKKVILG